MFQGRQFADQHFPLDLQADDEEKDRHQAQTTAVTVARIRTRELDVWEWRKRVNRSFFWAGVMVVDVGSGMNVNSCQGGLARNPINRRSPSLGGDNNRQRVINSNRPQGRAPTVCLKNFLFFMIEIQL